MNFVRYIIKIPDMDSVKERLKAFIEYKKFR